MMVSQMETGMIWMMTLGKNIKMKKLMKLIKEFIFGRRADAVCQIKTSYHTVQPKVHSKDFYEWCKEFRVGILSDRKPINY
jgi:hypothetical protein